MRMGDPKKCKGNNYNTLRHMFAASVTVALLTFSPFAIDPLLVQATGGFEDEEENRNVENSIIKGKELPSSTTTLPIQSSPQQKLDTEILNSDTGINNANPFAQPSLQEQELESEIEGTTPTTTTTTAACGQVASGLVELTADLNCSGDGIIISNPNTIVNLNGYSITGPGLDSSKVGVMVSNVDNVVVNGPGSISNFQAGVLINGVDEFKIGSTILENNQIAISMTGTDNTEISQNMIKNNHLGIASHSSSGSKITSNIMNGNQLAGITLVNTENSNVDMNNIHESQDGIFVDAQSSQNIISANNVLQNAVDINNANGLPININLNQYAENNCEVSNPGGLCIGR
jgi:parallel beta-helix repeat protein